MLEQLTKWVGKYPKTTITVILLLTIFFYFGLSKIEISTEMKDMFPEDDPVRVAFEKVDNTFGGAEYAMIVMDMGEVFNTEALQEIDRLTLKVERMKGVNSVLSITNIEEVRGVEGGIEVVELIEEIPTNQSELLKLRDRVLSDDDYAGQIVSENGKIALVLIQLLSNADKESVVNELRENIQELGLDGKACLTGEVVMDMEIHNLISNNMSRLLPIAVLMMIGILYFCFRNIRGVVLPVMIVIVTIIWTMGIMGYFGIPLTSISNIMPIILVSLGIADGIHIIASYREKLSLGSEKMKALTRTVVTVGLACFITTVTTMAGFSSLYSSSLNIIKDFGLVTAIGVGVAFIITVTLFLAFLTMLRPHKRELDVKRKVFLGGALIKWASCIVNRKKTVLAVAGLLALSALLGIPSINAESDFINFFKVDSPVRLAYDKVRENFGGANIIQVVVKGNIQDPKVLHDIEQFQNEIEEIEILSKPTSIVNVLRNTNKAMYEGKAEYEVLPEAEEEAAQYLLLLSMSGSDQLDNILSFDYDQALIQSRLSTNRSSKRSEMIKEVKKAIERNFNDDVEVTLTGSPVLSSRMVNMITKGQLQSLALAILFVFIIMMIISRSLTYGIFCTIPISLTVIMNFGIMGWFDIPLDVSSAMISSIVIGIGIDYAIHFFHRYKEELALGKSVEESIKITILNTGQAIFYNAAAVGLGFLVLTFASMPPLAIFGLLIALTMLFSSVASMTVLPALLYMRDRRRENTVKVNGYLNSNKMKVVSVSEFKGDN